MYEAPSSVPVSHTCGPPCTTVAMPRIYPSVHVCACVRKCAGVHVCVCVVVCVCVYVCVCTDWYVTQFLTRAGCPALVLQCGVSRTGWAQNRDATCLHRTAAWSLHSPAACINEICVYLHAHEFACAHIGTCANIYICIHMHMYK